MDIFFLAVGLVSLFFILRLYGSQRKPIKTFVRYSLVSVAILLLTSFLYSLFGLRSLPINCVTVFISLVFGIPGDALLIAALSFF